MSLLSSETPMNGSRVEAQCNTTTHLTCGDGTCLPIDKKCDGITDCPEGADELLCGLTRVLCSHLSPVPCLNTDATLLANYHDLIMYFFPLPLYPPLRGSIETLKALQEDTITSSSLSLLLCHCPPLLFQLPNGS